MSLTVLLYPRPALWADYGRAVAGALLCGVPLLLVAVNVWVAAILGLASLLFVVFLLRTVLRHMTRYVLGPDGLVADGPFGGAVEWNRLDRLTLSYYSTKRDRSDGWMQLALRSAGARIVKVDSSLDGFYDIVELAAEAAEARTLDLGRATRANLRSMGITVAGQEETV